VLEQDEAVLGEEVGGAHALLFHLLALQLARVAHPEPGLGVPLPDRPEGLDDVPITKEAQEIPDLPGREPARVLNHMAGTCRRVEPRELRRDDARLCECCAGPHAVELGFCQVLR